MSSQALVETLRQQHGHIAARELASRLGIAIHHAAWQIASGHIIQFAECTRQPLQITLNNSVIDRLARAKILNPASGKPADNPGGWKSVQTNWFAYEQIAEVIIAHELFHLLTPAPSVWVQHSTTESAAHDFAQSWTGLPFHPTRYEEILWATISA